MSVVLAVFAISIGTATFIESNFGSNTAWATVYNAWWFLLLLFIGMINLTASIFIKKLYRKEKLTIFIFHLAFIFILIGAGITHYLGFEGFMHIRQGETSNQIISNQSYLIVTATQNNESVTADKPVLVSEFSNNEHTLKLKLNNKPIKVVCEKIIPNAVEGIVESKIGKPMLNLVIAGEKGRQDMVLDESSPKNIGGIVFTFNDTANITGVNILSDTNSELTFKAPFKVGITEMATQKQDSLLPNEVHPLKIRTLYNFNGIEMVVKSFVPNGQVQIMKSDVDQGENSQDALQLKVEMGNESKSAIYFAQHNSLNKPIYMNFGNIKISVSFGAKIIRLPFTLGLIKFTLDHYPGSNSPSSFESRIQLNDSVNGINEQHRIFMNNVMKYRGYRFYQSSYDADELGTILSVNHDFWGTFVTYFGYLMLAFGIVLSLFNKNSRFRKLSIELNKLREAKKILTLAAIIAISAFFSHNNLLAQKSVPDSIIVNKQKAEQFGELLVQDQGGRIKPINTLSSELLRKISRTTEFEGQTPDQVFLGMMIYPEVWENIPMIKVSDPDVQKVLQINSSYAAFNNFLENTANGQSYKLMNFVNEAFKKKPASRSKFDSEVIRVDERLNLCYLIYTGELLKIFPKPGDANKTWYNFKTGTNEFHSQDSLFVKSIIPFFFQQIKSSVDLSNKYNAVDVIKALKNFQHQYGGNIIPSDFKIKAEILYNKSNIFDRVGSLYGLLGFILLVLQFIAIFNPGFKMRPVIYVATIIILAGFVFHLGGLILRWYISGHAPWSNAYESLVYIAFATMLAGVIFSQKSGITLSATALMAWLILFVAHLNWMDPEVSNLVPVLKSYWLLIHVAIITASYGFIALGALLAMLNLLVMIFQSPKSLTTSNAIIAELTIIIEMTLIIGLYAITIGTFLGGVWANESWGRYWGWDSKETWALVTILVYAFIAHMRMVPGLRGTYTFNLMALLGFSSVVMTYFGVNYYLSGLHSYAHGESAPFPMSGYITIIVVIVISVWAGVNYKRMDKFKNNVSIE